ncbi:MAG: hypothetical protein L3J70_11240 [Gammaproteobacteria bacterium]|nr:hypothetical protein [Gammaproteobacteria bacterium]
MKCIPIYDVKFDSSSIAAINDIKRRRNLTLVLSQVMPFGTMANIFVGNGALKSSYNIKQTDFEALAQAMASLPEIQRKIIRDIAKIEAVSHIGKESTFWKGVADGCKIN